MELAIYFANLKQLLDLDEALRPLDPDSIPSFISTLVFNNDTSSREYYANLVAIQWFEEHTSRTGDALSRLYFGQEFCEHLIPSPDDLTQAYYYCRQLGWDFTYVSSFCTDEALARQEQNLAVLADMDDDDIEVVVNDWGLLRLMQRQFPQLDPVLGRLLSKQKRLGRYTTVNSLWPINRNGLETPEEDLRQNQLAALRDTSLTSPDYRRELCELGFARVDVDIVPEGLNLPDEPDGLETSCYYPWGYMAGGRNCLTAGVLDPQREFVVVDGPCPRPCQRYNKAAVRLHGEEILIQRGNSVFAFHTEYSSPYMTGVYPISRIVLQPYIPI